MELMSIHRILMIIRYFSFNTRNQPVLNRVLIIFHQLKPDYAYPTMMSRDKNIYKIQMCKDPLIMTILKKP